MTKPFTIESTHIKLLDEQQLTELLNRLLQCECVQHGIAQRSSEVALNIKRADGGEDGRISWNEGPEFTNFIPNRLTLFQNKATSSSLGPAKYANEIVKDSNPNELKPKVEEIFEQAGTYIFFTNQEINHQDMQLRIDAVRNRLREFNKTYADSCQILIYEASQIAKWVNNFVPAIVAVQHWVGIPFERGLKTYELWSEHAYLNKLPFIDVDSRKEISDALSEEIIQPKSSVRIMGLSGLGKTRLAFRIVQENKNIRELTVYIDANYVGKIDGLVADWVSLGLKAIVIVDNCDFKLHKSLEREVYREGSQLSLLTLDYNLETVSSDTRTYHLQPMATEEIKLLINPLYKDQISDLDRIAVFAQGFPQMAVLIAEARLNDDPKVGELTDDDLVDRLLWTRDATKDPDKLKILQFCSLFDVFGIDNEVEKQIEFIAKSIDINIDKVYACIHEYTERGLIDRRGRFGQVVPKPLAIRLAGKWWSETREKRQLELLKDLPDEMVQAFCDQVGKMDFHTDVKKLTEELCGLQGPFGQAEVILSVRGSMLFRAFVNVNPEHTSRALYQVFENLDQNQLIEIDGDVRRNLVWALEKLCFHADEFPESAWCLFLLALAENESWSNNATGIFAQLYNVYLSGTAAQPHIRFELLNRILDLKQQEADLIILNALAASVNTSGTTRTAGAEYQGAGAPLKEWEPKIWNDIFDFWQNAFDLLMTLLERGVAQKQKVIEVVGESIRGFVWRGRIEMMDTIIQKVIFLNGPYWPSAVDSIKQSLAYDITEMPEDLATNTKKVLEQWLELLNPEDAELSHKLRILVLNPPWEPRENKDGKYVDAATENARELARIISVEELLPEIDILLEQGEQRQSFPFGQQLAQEVQDVNIIIDKALEQIIGCEQPNINFLKGLFSGTFMFSSEEWQRQLDKLTDEKLIYLYPELLLSGQVLEQHFDTLFELIEKGTLPIVSARVLQYGWATNSISPDFMSRFCVKLAKKGDLGSWIALEIIYGYIYQNDEAFLATQNITRELVTEVPLIGKESGNNRDVYIWSELTGKLLETSDETFAKELTNQILKASKEGLEYSDTNHVKSILHIVLGKFPETTWSIFGNAIIQAEGVELYRLQQILGRGIGIVKGKTPGLIDSIPINTMISWCEQQKELGPQFVAGSIKIFEHKGEKQTPSPMFIALLGEFGGDDEVARAFSRNLGTRGWSGSLVPHLESEKEALLPLLEHDNIHIRNWTKNHILYLEFQIKNESDKDDERDIGIY